jgi:hypothetical protein
MFPLTDKNNTILIVAITLGFIAILFVVDSVMQRSIMAKNIDNAINKGIDPITVRCAYAPATDNVCLAYAITHKPLEAPEAPKKK